MKITRLDHLVFAVENIDAAAEAWASTLGLKVESTVQPPNTHMELAFIPTGDNFLELVRPTTDSHHIAERGEGMFSVALEVDDVDAAVAELRSKGVEISDPEAGVLPKTRVARIPRAAAHGVAVQLIER
ncbi:MAG: VOC family protein [Dehalococcoidia bacterium]